MDLVELEAVVGLPHPGHYTLETLEDPSVHLQHLFVVHEIPGGVEIVEVAQEEAHRVSYLSVGVHQPSQDGLGYAHVFRVVLGGHPEAQDVGPVLVYHVLGGNDIAHGLGHLFAFTVHHKAVGEDRLEGGPIPGGHRLDEGTLKPAPVLVGTLQVHVGRPLQILPVFQDGSVAGSRIKPHVQDVFHFLEFLSPALGAGEVGG